VGGGGGGGVVGCFESIENGQIREWHYLDGAILNLTTKARRGYNAIEGMDGRLLKKEKRDPPHQGKKNIQKDLSGGA